MATSVDTSSFADFGAIGITGPSAETAFFKDFGAFGVTVPSADTASFATAAGLSGGDEVGGAGGEEVGGAGGEERVPLATWTGGKSWSSGLEPTGEGSALGGRKEGREEGE